KNALLELVWPKLVVEENNLQVQISTLRRLLGPQAISTVPGRGYKFTLLPSKAAESQAAAPIPPPSTSNAPLGTLPPQIPHLYGRNDAVAALEKLLQSNRVVSVVGPAGIGKTRLAQAVAHAQRERFADGVWFVELAPLSDSSLVISTIA